VYTVTVYLILIVIIYIVPSIYYTLIIVTSCDVCTAPRSRCGQLHRVETTRMKTVITRQRRLSPSSDVLISNNDSDVGNRYENVKRGTITNRYVNVRHYTEKYGIGSI